MACREQRTVHPAHGHMKTAASVKNMLHIASLAAAAQPGPLDPNSTLKATVALNCIQPLATAINQKTLVFEPRMRCCAQRGSQSYYAFTLDVADGYYGAVNVTLSEVSPTFVQALTSYILNGCKKDHKTLRGLPRHCTSTSSVQHGMLFGPASCKPYHHLRCHTSW